MQLMNLVAYTLPVVPRPTGGAYNFTDRISISEKSYKNVVWTFRGRG